MPAPNADRLLAPLPAKGSPPLAAAQAFANATGRRYEYVAGVDEAGRGAWAGPVVAAAVILPSDFPREGLDDSKKLTPPRREALFDNIIAGAAAWSLGIVSARYVDRFNVLRAALEAMRRAVVRLPLAPDLVLVDGNHPIPISSPQVPLVGGDGRYDCIAAASILAKVYRDRVMNLIHGRCPHYGFNLHKGYGTARHAAALQRFGASRYHRLTFKPVHGVLPYDAPLPFPRT